eukprot:scaffold33579_cov58-Phaeocystis_antarctica.AAC.5
MSGTRLPDSARLVHVLVAHSACAHRLDISWSGVGSGPGRESLPNLKQPKEGRTGNPHLPTSYVARPSELSIQRDHCYIRRLGAGPCRGPLDSPNRSLTDPRHLPDTAPAGAHL